MADARGGTVAGGGKGVEERDAAASLLQAKVALAVDAACRHAEEAHDESRRLLVTRGAVAAITKVVGIFAGEWRDKGRPVAGTAGRQEVLERASE